SPWQTKSPWLWVLGEFWLGSPCPWLTAVPPALLPYEPRVPPGALLGKVTATTFVPGETLLRLPPPRQRLRHRLAAGGHRGPLPWLLTPLSCATQPRPPSETPRPVPMSPSTRGCPPAHAYMTLETAAAAYACSVPGPVLRVACNGPLPSPGPYRVKFLVMGCHGPKAETRWSDPILLRRGTGGSGAGAAPPSPHIPWAAASPRATTPNPRGEESSPGSSARPIPECPPSSPCVPHPVPFQPAARAPLTPHPHTAAATWSSSPPSWPASVPGWPWQRSVPWGTRAERGRAGGDVSMGSWESISSLIPRTKRGSREDFKS
uniref:Uncharacterized protein n=1 Tax=Anas platyrhynchos TaxID=8839 RepID=A0A8B9SM28_ANAPL